MSQPQCTILIIDDSPEDRELYRRYLLKDEAYSYTILEASLGRQGLALWQHHPDVLLLDYRLPDLDGLEFLAQLPSPLQPPCLPVVMLTGLGNEAIAVKAIKAGAQDYLVKGQITPERLHLAIHGAIESVRLRTQLQQRIDRERVVSQITRQIHQTLDLDEILQTTVREVRQFLQTDRVLIFRLQADGSGTITTESVGDRSTSLLANSFYDPCFNKSYVEPFRQGLVTVKPDIHDGSIDRCHFELLASLQVRANLVVPILQGNQLWGMLIAHHCAAPRQWLALEIDLLKELATQLGIALQQAELYQRSQAELAERKQVEAALRQKSAELERQLQKFDAVISSVPDFIYIFDLSGRFIDVNKPLLDLWQKTAAEVIGKNFLELDYPVDLAIKLQNQIQLVIQTRQPLKDKTPFTSKFATRAYEYIFVPIFAATGVVEMVAGITRDITERETLLQQEQAAREAAERANRVKDEFLAVLSHELRTPLNPILGWTKLLQNRQFDPIRAKEALAVIERNAKLQAQLIDDLLDVSRIVSGKLLLNSAPVNLLFVISSALETVRLSAEAKQIQIETILELEVESILGDAARLHQVVWNLLSNAVKFTDEGGQIMVKLIEEVSHRSSFVKLTVTDTGKGIKPEFLPHLFEYFRQEDVSTTRRFGGLGLGLAIVRQIVELHGGTVYAESQGEGQGATFTVRLPIQRIESAPDHFLN